MSALVSSAGRLRLALLLCVALLTFGGVGAQQSNAALVFSGDYDTGSLLSQWNGYQTAPFGNPCLAPCSNLGYAIQLQTSEVREGSHAARFEVRNNPNGGSVDEPFQQPGQFYGPRAQVQISSSSVRAYEGNERWHRFSVKFDQSFPTMNGTSFAEFAQFKTGDGPPAFGFYVMDEKILLQKNIPDAHVPWGIPLVRGQWIDFQFRVKWSSSDAVGQIELYVNGTRQTMNYPFGSWNSLGRPSEGQQTYQGRTLPSSSASAYYTEGWYMANSRLGTYVVYHDGFEIHDSPFAGYGGSTNQTPQVAITAPAAGANLEGSLAYGATASDASGIDRVEFRVDGNLILSDSSSPYGGSMSLSGISSGEHTLSATAFDNEGQQASVNRNFRVADPPSHGQSVPSANVVGNPVFAQGASNWQLKGTNSGNSLAVLGTPTGEAALRATNVGSLPTWLKEFSPSLQQGDVSQTKVYESAAWVRAADAAANGDEVKSCLWALAETCTSYTLTGSWQRISHLGEVRYKTSSGAPGIYAPVGKTDVGMITLRPISPSVQVTSPVEDQEVGQTLSWATTASDPNGIDRVEILLEGETTVLATDASAPYSGSVTLPAVAEETDRVLEAHVYDNSGHVTVAPVEVVQAPEPPSGPALTVPAGNLTQNPVFANGLTNWGMYLGTSQAVSSGGSTYALISGNSGVSAYSIGDNTATVPTPVSGGVYRAEVWMRAANPAAVGTTFAVCLRQVGGANNCGSSIALSNEWQMVSRQQTATGTGTLDTYAVVNGAVSAHVGLYSMVRVS